MSDRRFKKLLDKIEKDVKQRKEIISAIMTSNMSDRDFEKLLYKTREHN